MPGLLAAAMAKSSGVLYEDAFLQVGCKKAIAGAEGTLTLQLKERTLCPPASLEKRRPGRSGEEATP
jgi:hypothetical protein